VPAGFEFQVKQGWLRILTWQDLLSYIPSAIDETVPPDGMTLDLFVTFARDIHRLLMGEWQ
jgi:hypothetical protein